MRCTTRFGSTCSTGTQPGILAGHQRHLVAPVAPSGRCSRRRSRRCRRPGGGSSRGRRARGSSAAGSGSRGLASAWPLGRVLRASSGAPPGSTWYRFPCGRKLPARSDDATRPRSAYDAAPMQRPRRVPMRACARRADADGGADLRVLSILMVGQGLLPGRTLSSSDGLLSQVPWQASKPAERARARAPTSSSPTPRTCSSRCCSTRARSCRDVPLWNPVPHGRTSAAGRRAVGGVLALQRAVLRAAVLEVAGGRGDPEAVPRRARRVRAGAGARAAVRRRAAERASCSRSGRSSSSGWRGR